jgi:hypothetical protein
MHLRDRMNMPTTARRLMLGLCAALAAGCGAEAPAPETAVASSTSAPAAANDYTAAVPLGAIAAAARLQFQLDSRPVVGGHVTVRYRVTPTATLRKIQVVFEPEPGLAIVDELRATVVIDGPATAEARPHELQVVASATGVLLLKAHVLTESDQSTQSTEFAIPVLVASAEAAPAP